MRLPEKGHFEDALVPVRVRIAPLVRLSKFPETEPYWAKGASYRFDDPSADIGNRFGVLYLGDSLGTAFAESIIHETSMYTAGHHVIAESDLNSRQMVTYKGARKKTLKVADFTGEALKGLGLTNDVSSGDAYSIPQLWARAVFEATDWDGIRYVSRQANDSCAYAVFERSGLQLGSHRSLLMSERARLCATFRVRTI